MKICFVSMEYPPESGGGGIGTQNYLKAHGLSARGHEVHVVCASWDREARTYRDGRATIHRIAEPQLRVDGYEQSTYWLAYSMAVAEKLYALGKEIKFDIIQFAEYGGEGFVYQTDTFANRQAKYVVQLHGPLAMFAETMGWPESDSMLLKVGEIMERVSICHVDRIMASSHYIAEFCAKRYGVTLDDIDVVHSAVDTVKFSPRPQPQDHRRPRILFVGKLVGNKGITLLVNAVIALRARFPDICLRAIGRSEPDVLKRLDATIAAAGAQSNFDFPGFVPNEELPQHYAWCDFFAAPSTVETLGNIYLESMACGRPPIACRTGGTPEVVIDRETGLLIPPQDAKALEKAIVTLTEDNALRERLGRNGRRWVEENVSIEKYINKVEAVFQELVSR